MENFSKIGDMQVIKEEKSQEVEALSESGKPSIIVLNASAILNLRPLQEELQKLFFEPIWACGLTDYSRMLPYQQLSESLIYSMHSSILALAQEGNHLLVEHSFYSSAVLRDFLQKFSSFSVYFVGVYGLDAALHEHCIYDISVNLEKSSAKLCAKQIFKKLQALKEAHAMRALQYSFSFF